MIDRRVFVIVIDSCGCGNAPDAEDHPPALKLQSQEKDPKQVQVQESESVPDQKQEKKMGKEQERLFESGLPPIQLVSEYARKPALITQQEKKRRYKISKNGHLLAIYP